MDSPTHVVFARKLIGNLGGNEALAVASLFPQIDRRPPTLHRLYAHTFFKAQGITRLGTHLLFGAERPAQTVPYEEERFQAEKSRFIQYLSDNQLTCKSDRDSKSSDIALMAYVSHLYLDTFNQPVQAFAPASIQCAGQWKLWERLGDFRLKLYTTPAIDELREEWMSRSYWRDINLSDAKVITLAMLLRIRALSYDPISQEIEDSARLALGLGDFQSNSIKRVVTFFEELEQDLSNLHLKVILGDSTSSFKKPETFIRSQESPSQVI